MEMEVEVYAFALCLSLLRVATGIKPLRSMTTDFRNYVYNSNNYLFACVVIEIDIVPPRACGEY